MPLVNYPLIVLRALPFARPLMVRSGIESKGRVAKISRTVQPQEATMDDVWEGVFPK